MQAQKIAGLSAFIICKNEEDRILLAINSLRELVEEIVVVDSGSTDKTVEVAQRLGAKVFYNEWRGYGLQKRFAEECCSNDWLLNLDADEELTSELAKEIRGLFLEGPKNDIYKIHILDVYPHEDQPKPWAYGYWQFRLYNRSFGRFSESSVHDTVQPLPNAKIARLSGKMNHRSFRSLNFWSDKFNRYSSMQVADMVTKNRKLPHFRLVIEFPIAFLKSYILRRGFLYGWWGLVIAHNYAFGRFLRIAKYYEHELLKRS
ncbi:glycosyltransferase family 2 protein [Polycladidibacter hongkongensis]|uniref:glycosyltransferase family 2 protein n=1 Tax=Polycladidibacter hongkongensis TaxID=1647556 RepID=UPI0008300726|nr:glycosyltransferase family 2 protein [Pseudovibrio hongkongensis]